MLGGEELVELVVRDLDPEAAEKPRTIPGTRPLRGLRGRRAAADSAHEKLRPSAPELAIAPQGGQVTPQLLGEQLVEGEVEERVPPVKENGAQHAPEDSGAALVRRILYALLALGPLVIVLDSYTEVGEIATSCSLHSPVPLRLADRRGDWSTPTTPQGRASAAS